MIQIAGTLVSPSRVNLDADTRFSNIAVCAADYRGLGPESSVCSCVLDPFGVAAKACADTQQGPWTPRADEWTLPG
jgi:hypothetical protein